MKFAFRATSIAAMTLAGLAAFSCGKKEGGDSSQSSGTGGKPPETGEASTVSMSGNLALTTSDAAATEVAALTQDSYNLYCVTFEETPKACKGDIGADGKFAFSCEGFVGRAFGCFLRNGSKTLGTVEFGEESQLLAGAGNLVFAMVFNPETGSIKATIDVAASSSLSEEALAAFKDYIEQNKTQMADLTGNWEIKPDCSKNPEMCPPDMQQGDETFPVYMEQYTHTNGKTYLAMWSDENRKNQCGGSANLSFKVAGAAVDFKSKDSLFDGLSKATASLDAGLKAKIKKLAIERANKQYAWCADQKESPYTEENCKLVAAEMESHSIKDEFGNVKTESYPKFYSADEFEKLVSIQGTSVSDVTCAFEWKEGVAPCPWTATKNADGTGTFKQAMAGESRLLLVCRDPYNSDGLMHEPATATSLPSAVAAMANTNNKPVECDKVADGEFNGQYVGAAREAARAVLELARMDDSHGWAEEMCNRHTVPSGFSWSQCNGGKDQPMLCWEGSHIRQQLNIVVENGKLAEGGEIMTDWFNAEEMGSICPTAAAAAKQAMDSKEYWDNKDAAKNYATQCRSEFLASKKTAAAQAEAFVSIGKQWTPIAELLYCDAGTKEAAKALAANSCIADARLDYNCGPNGCEEVLMCSGSSAEGRCYDDAGVFVGRVAGRDDNMVMKMGIGGAFSMSESQQDFWRSFDPKNNEQQNCVFSRISTMNNLKIDDNSFSGIYASNEKFECKSEKKEGEGGGDMQKMGLTQDGGGEGGGEGKEGGTMTIPFVATRK
jgi:hypothetical protein